VVLVCSLSVSSQSAEQLTVEEVLDVPVFNPNRPLDFAPNGTAVAYTLQRAVPPAAPSRSLASPSGVPLVFAGSELWVNEIDQPAGKRLSGSGSDWGPTWSPDSRMLAFYSDRDGQSHLWIWDRRNVKRGASAVTAGAVFDQLRWAFDSRHVLVKLRSAAAVRSRQKDNFAVGGSSGPSFRLFRSPSPEGNKVCFSPVLAAHRGDLALIDVRAGRATRLTTTNPIVTRIDASPSHKLASVLVARDAGAPSLLPHFDVLIVSLGTGAVRTVALDAQPSTALSWSRRDGALVYGAGNRVVLVDLSGGAPHREFSVAGAAQRPAWDPDGGGVYAVVGANTIVRIATASGAESRPIAQLSGHVVRALLTQEDGNTAWLVGGHSVVVMAQNESTLEMGFHFIDIRTGAVSAHLVAQQRLGGDAPTLYADVSNDGRRLVYLRSTPESPDDVWTCTESFSAPRQLSAVAPALTSKAIGRERVVRWQTADGAPRRGLLLLPAGYRQDRRYPLIVWVYGGSLRYANAFGWWGGFFNMQVFASRGYAVFYPDVPAPGDGEPLKYYANVVLPGIDSLVKEGLVDAERIGLYGHSHGGYAVLSLLVQSDRFRAAVESAGPANLLSLYATMVADGAATQTAVVPSEFEMKGAPWEATEQYVRNSPFLSLNKIKTPLLLLQGDADVERTPQSDAVYVGLSKLGRRVDYVKYLSEDHSPQFWSLHNQRDALTRVIAWFDEHLRK
jgi:dipeptidyl aminopeptidase/acylaminoacyl peptidase